MIIVDDCSTDQTTAIIKKYCTDDKRIKFLQLEKNSGASVARNKAIEQATGQFIAFLDSDDLWLPDKLSRQLKFMKEQNAVLTYTAYKKIDEAGNIGKNIIEVPSEIGYRELLKTNHIACLTAIYDQSKLGKVFMPLILRRQDLALWLKILKKGYKAKGYNDVLAYYRVRKNSVSSNKLKSAYYQWKLYREIENLTVWQSLYFFPFYIYYAYLKFLK